MSLSLLKSFISIIYNYIHTNCKILKMGEIPNVLHTAWLYLKPVIIFQQNLVIFKTGAHGRRPCMPGFLKSFCSHVSMCVCVSTPKGINNQCHDVV